MAACLMLASCGKESLDYNHPDVDLFVKQMKTGKYSTQSPEGLSNVPKFAKEDIEELLKYAEMCIRDSRKYRRISPSCFSVP